MISPTSTLLRGVGEFVFWKEAVQTFDEITVIGNFFLSCGLRNEVAPALRCAADDRVCARRFVVYASDLRDDKWDETEGLI